MVLRGRRPRATHISSFDFTTLNQGAQSSSLTNKWMDARGALAFGNSAKNDGFLSSYHHTLVS